MVGPRLPVDWMTLDAFRKNLKLSPRTRHTLVTGGGILTFVFALFLCLSLLLRFLRARCCGVCVLPIVVFVVSFAVNDLPFSFFVLICLQE